MSKMNPEIKARWVAALRSGEYRQTKERLRANGRYCCLGVLCDLYAKEQGVDNWPPAKYWRDGDELPSDEVCDWAGFPITDEDDDGNPQRCASDYDPAVTIRHSDRCLSAHNDTGRTFAEIADAIEEQL